MIKWVYYVLAVVVMGLVFGIYLMSDPLDHLIAEKWGDSADLYVQSVADASQQRITLDQPVDELQPAHPFWLNADAGYNCNNSIPTLASPCGKYFLTYSQFGDGHDAVRLWDRKTCKEIRRFTGHTARVLGVDFSDDGRYLLTGGQDHFVRLWDVHTGQQLREYQFNVNLINAVAFSPDGSRFAADNYDKICIVDLSTGKILSSWNGRDESQKNQQLPVTQASLGRPFSPAHSLVWSQDGQQILTANNDRMLRLWDVQTGLTVKTFQGHQHELYKAVFSPNGRIILSIGANFELLLWSVRTGHLLHRLKLTESGDFLEVNRRNIGFSSDGQYVLAGALGTWSVMTGEPVDQERWQKIGQDYQVTADDHLVYDPQFNTMLVQLDPALHAPVMQSNIAAIHPGRTQVLVNDYGYGAYLFDLKTARVAQHFVVPQTDFGMHALGFMASGQQVFATNDNLFIWDTSTGKITRQFLDKHVKEIEFHETVAYPDGKRLLIRSIFDQALFNLDIQTGQHSPFSPVDGYISRFVLSPDGKLMCVRLQSDLQLWDTQKQRLLWSIKPKPWNYEFALFTPDGKHLLVKQNFHKVFELDIQSGQVTRSLDQVCEDAQCFSADGQYLLCRQESNRQLLLLSWPACKQVQSFDADVKFEQIQFMPDGRHILTMHADYSMRFWDITTGREVARRYAYKDGGWLVMTPDNRYDTSNGADGFTSVYWVLDDGNEPVHTQPLNHFKDQYYTPGLLGHALGIH